MNAIVVKNKCHICGNFSAVTVYEKVTKDKISFGDSISVHWGNYFLGFYVSCVENEIFQFFLNNDTERSFGKFLVTKS